MYAALTFANSVTKRCAAAGGADAFPKATAPCICAFRRSVVAGHQRGRTTSDQVTLHSDVRQRHLGSTSECVRKPLPHENIGVTADVQHAAACNITTRSTSPRKSCPDTGSYSITCEIADTKAGITVHSTAAEDSVSSGSQSKTGSGSSGSRSGEKLRYVVRDSRRNSTFTCVPSCTPEAQHNTGVRRKTSSAESSNIDNVECNVSNTTMRASSAKSTKTSRGKTRSVERQGSGTSEEETAGRSRSCTPGTTKEGGKEAVFSTAPGLAHEGDGKPGVPSRTWGSEVSCVHPKGIPRRCPAREGTRGIRSTLNARTPEQQQQQRHRGGCVQGEAEKTLGHFVERSFWVEEGSPRQQQKKQFSDCIRDAGVASCAFPLQRHVPRFCSIHPTAISTRDPVQSNQSFVSESLPGTERSQKREEAPRRDPVLKDQHAQPLEEQPEREQQTQRQLEQHRELQVQLWQAQELEHQWDRERQQSEQQHQGVRPVAHGDHEHRHERERQQLQRQPPPRQRHHHHGERQGHRRAAKAIWSPSAPVSPSKEERRLQETSSGSVTAVAPPCAPQLVTSILNSLDGRSGSTFETPKRSARRECNRRCCGTLSNAAVTTQGQPNWAARQAEQTATRNSCESSVGGAATSVRAFCGANSAAGHHNCTPSPVQETEARVQHFRVASAAAQSTPATDAQEGAATEKADEARAALTVQAAGGETISAAEAFRGVNADASAMMTGEHQALSWSTHPTREPFVRTAGQEGVYSADLETGELDGILSLCGLCTEAKADVILLPCGHGGLCQSCAVRMVEKHRERLNREAGRRNWLLRWPDLAGAEYYSGESATEWAGREVVSTTYLQRQQHLLPRCPLCRRQVERLLKVDSICCCGAYCENASNGCSTTRERIVTAHTVAVLLGEIFGNRGGAHAWR